MSTVAAIIRSSYSIRTASFVTRGIGVDSEGSLYIGEVSQTSGGTQHYCPDNPLNAHCFQKFIRRG
ncbi:MAG: hypothetical protein ISR47_00855 [Rhodospirillales bacterium]|nr:hypothetical protein [Rhodospirillales bacterium]